MESSAYLESVARLISNTAIAALIALSLRKVSEPKLLMLAYQALGKLAARLSPSQHSSDH